MNFGVRIYELRHNAGLSQEKLADKLNISRQSVTKWEKNDSLPDIENLLELSQIFGVSIDYLIKGRNKYAKSENSSIKDFESVVSFLCTAKKNTYAAHGAEAESSRLNSHDLVYEEGIFSYLDSYFGGEKFLGEEVLYLNKTPFWAMNYSGRVIDGNFSGDFLKECLLAVKPDKPFRGPNLHLNGNFTYHCNVRGDFDWFRGEEEIFFQTIKVYECVFHGGTIK